MKLDRGEARNSTASAISVACAVRPSGRARPSSSLTSPPFGDHSLGGGRPRCNAVDPDAVRPELGGPGARQRLQCGFGGAITRRTGNALEGDHAGDVDDAAATASHHARRQAGDQEIGAAHVGVERRGERRHVLLDGQRPGEAGGVVDHDVDAAVAALPHQRSHRIEVGKIGGHESHPGTEFGDGGGATLCRAAGDDHRGAVLRQQPCGFEPDARGPAGHQGGLADQLVHWFASQSARRVVASVASSPVTRPVSPTLVPK